MDSDDQHKFEMEASEMANVKLETPVEDQERDEGQGLADDEKTNTKSFEELRNTLRSATPSRRSSRGNLDLRKRRRDISPSGMKQQAEIEQLPLEVHSPESTGDAYNQMMDAPIVQADLNLNSKQPSRLSGISGERKKVNSSKRSKSKLSQERIKNLVHETSKKASQIWLKNERVVRVPRQFQRSQQSNVKSKNSAIAVDQGSTSRSGDRDEYLQKVTYVDQILNQQNVVPSAVNRGAFPRTGDHVVRRSTIDREALNRSSYGDQVRPLGDYDDAAYETRRQLRTIDHMPSQKSLDNQQKLMNDQQQDPLPLTSRNIAVGKCQTDVMLDEEQPSERRLYKSSQMKVSKRGSMKMKGGGNDSDSQLNKLSSGTRSRKSLIAPVREETLPDQMEREVPKKVSKEVQVSHMVDAQSQATGRGLGVRSDREMQTEKDIQNVEIFIASSRDQHEKLEDHEKDFRSDQPIKVEMQEQQQIRELSLSNKQYFDRSSFGNGTPAMDSDKQQKFEAILAKEPQLQIRLQGDNHLKIDVNTTYTIVEAQKPKEVEPELAAPAITKPQTVNKSVQNDPIEQEEKEPVRVDTGTGTGNNTIDAEQQTHCLFLPQQVSRMDTEKDQPDDDPREGLVSRGSLATQSMRTAGTDVVEEKRTYTDLGVVQRGGFSGQYPNPVEEWHKKILTKPPKEDYPMFLAQQRAESFALMHQPRTTQHATSASQMHLRKIPLQTSVTGGSDYQPESGTYDIKQISQAINAGADIIKEQSQQNSCSSKTETVRAEVFAADRGININDVPLERPHRLSSGRQQYDSGEEREAIATGMSTAPPRKLAYSRSRATIPAQLSQGEKLAQKSHQVNVKDMRMKAVSDYQLRTQEVNSMQARTKWGHEQVEGAQKAVAGQHKASAVLLQKAGISVPGSSIQVDSVAKGSTRTQKQSQMKIKTDQETSMQEERKVTTSVATPVGPNDTGSAATVHYVANQSYENAPRLIDEEKDLSSLTGATLDRAISARSTLLLQAQLAQAQITNRNDTNMLMRDEAEVPSLNSLKLEEENQNSRQEPITITDSQILRSGEQSMEQQIVPKSEEQDVVRLGPYEPNKEKIRVSIDTEDTHGSGLKGKRRQSGENVRKSIFTASEMDGPAESISQTMILEPQRGNTAAPPQQEHFMSNEALFQSEHQRGRPPSQRGLVGALRYPISDLSEGNMLQSEKNGDIYFSGKLAAKDAANNNENESEPVAQIPAARHLLNIQGDVIEEEAPQTQRSDAEVVIPAQSRVNTMPDSKGQGNDVVFFDESGPIDISERLNTQGVASIIRESLEEEAESGLQPNSTIEQVAGAAEVESSQIVHSAFPRSLNGIDSATFSPHVKQTARGYKAKLTCTTRPVVNIRANIAYDDSKFEKANEKLVDAFFSKGEASQHSSPTLGQASPRINDKKLARPNWHDERSSRDLAPLKAAGRNNNQDIMSAAMSAGSQSAYKQEAAPPAMRTSFDKSQLNLLTSAASPQPAFLSADYYLDYYPNGLTVNSSVDQRHMRRPLNDFNSRFLAAGARVLPDEEPRRFKNGQHLQPLSSLAAQKRERLSFHGDGVMGPQAYGLASSSLTSMSHQQRLQIAQLQRMYQSRQGSLPPEPTLKLAKRSKPRRKRSVEREDSDTVLRGHNRTSLVIDASASPDMQARVSYNDAQNRLLQHETVKNREMPSSITYGLATDQGALKLDQKFSLADFIEHHNLQGLIQRYEEHGVVKMRVGQKGQSVDIAGSGGQSPKNRRLHALSTHVTANGLMLTERSRQKHQAQTQFEEGLSSGIFDIEQAFALVQLIKIKSGRIVMSEDDIVDYLKSKNLIRDQVGADGSNQLHDRESQVKQYKWREVMKFFQSNPHVLVQLLSLSDAPLAGHSPRAGSMYASMLDQRSPLSAAYQAHFSSINHEPGSNRSRPRYTDKVLNQIERSMPGVLRRSQDEIILQQDNFLKQVKAQQKGLAAQAGRSKKDRYQRASVAPEELAPLSLEEHLKKKEKIYHDRKVKLAGAARSPRREAGLPSKKNSPRRANKSTTKAKPSEKPAQGKGTRTASKDAFKSRRASNPQNNTAGPKVISPRSRPNGDRTTTANDDSKVRSIDKLPHVKGPRESVNVFKRGAVGADEEAESQITNLNVGPIGLSKDASFKKITSMPTDGLDMGTKDVRSQAPHEMKSQMAQNDMRKPKTNELVRRPRQINQPFRLPQQYAEPATASQVQNYRDEAPGFFNSKSNYTNVFERGKASGPIQRLDPANLPSLDESAPLVGRFGTLENDARPYLVERRTTEGQRRPHKGLQPLLARDASEGKTAQEVSRAIEFKNNMMIFEDKQLSLEQKSEITVNGTNSVYLRRYEELNTQKQKIEEEEAELNAQRRKIQMEKDRITKQLKRIDKKQELDRQEEHVKKQRLVLEIEKKALREDIGELDALKRMLEEKRKDTTVGFSELAESNKEMKSLKSGELHRERSLMFSKQSMRSKGRELRKQDGYGSVGMNIVARQSVDEIAQPVGSFGSGSNDRNPLGTISTVPVMNESDNANNGVNPAHAKTEKNFVAPLNTSETQKMDLRNTNQKIVEDDPYFENREMAIDEAEFEVKDYQDAHNRTTGGVFRQVVMHDSFDDRPRLSEVHKLTSDRLLQQQASAVVPETALPQLESALREVDTPGSQVLDSPSFERKPETEDARDLASPQPSVRSTFLGGTGIFDWATSPLMHDIKNGQEEFCGRPGAEELNHDIYHEQEAKMLFDKFVNDRKSVKEHNIEDVFQRSMKTLKVLMEYMNQASLFQLIVNKYQQVTNETTTKLLMRINNLLEARHVAYAALKALTEFEQDTKDMKRKIDKFLEHSQNEQLLNELKQQACVELPAKAKGIVEDITSLRDDYKLFVKIEATTSKGRHVSNVMAYKRRDAIRHTIKEYDAVKRLVQVVDIEMPPVRP